MFVSCIINHLYVNILVSIHNKIWATKKQLRPTYDSHIYIDKTKYLVIFYIFLNPMQSDYNSK